MIFCQLSNRSINDVELIQVIIVIERSRCYATSSNMKTLIFFLFFFFFLIRNCFYIVCEVKNEINGRRNTRLHTLHLANLQNRGGGKLKEKKGTTAKQKLYFIRR